MENKNDVVIYFENYHKIKYNTKINTRSDCEAFVMSNGIVRRLNRLDDYNLNPRKLNIFQLHKIDKTSYNVYHIKTSFFDGNWSGNVQYLDKRLEGIQEKVFIKVNYSFRILSPDKVIVIISDQMNEFDVKYFNNKINKKIDNTVKQFIVFNLNSDGFIETQCKIVSIAKSIENEINENILNEYGIMIVNLNFSLEESDDHYDMRRNLEWEKLRVKEV